MDATPEYHIGSHQALLQNQLWGLPQHEPQPQPQPHPQTYLLEGYGNQHQYNAPGLPSNAAYEMVNPVLGAGVAQGGQPPFIQQTMQLADIPPPSSAYFSQQQPPYGYPVPPRLYDGYVSGHQAIGVAPSFSPPVQAAPALVVPMNPPVVVPPPQVQTAVAPPSLDYPSAPNFSRLDAINCHVSSGQCLKNQDNTYKVSQAPCIIAPPTITILQVSFMIKAPGPITQQAPSFPMFVQGNSFLPAVQMSVQALPEQPPMPTFMQDLSILAVGVAVSTSLALPSVPITLDIDVLAPPAF
ncbi:hypothetical protein EDB19DRAFT_1913093 [Suillus lakei]|nr:hypothetical protein EDB19DRAFT_1913093 [Suillus lakei]